MTAFQNLRVMSVIFALLNSMGQVINVMVITRLGMQQNILLIIPLTLGAAATIIFLAVALLARKYAQDTSAPRRFWLVILYSFCCPIITYAMYKIFGTAPILNPATLRTLFTLSVLGFIPFWIFQFTTPFTWLDKISR